MKRSPRLKGMALIPLQEVSEAVIELRRAVKELGTASDSAIRRTIFRFCAKSIVRFLPETPMDPMTNRFCARCRRSREHWSVVPSAGTPRSPKFSPGDAGLLTQKKCRCSRLAPGADRLLLRPCGIGKHNDLIFGEIDLYPVASTDILFRLHFNG